MRKSVKLISMILAILLISILLFSGCTSDNGSSKDVSEDNNIDKDSKKEENSDKKVELDIFQFKVEVAKELQEATEAYTAENENVKINLETVGGGQDYGAALRAKFQSGNEPAIFNVGGPQDVEDWINKLENLSDQPWASMALPGVLEGVKKDDEVYGMPYSMEGYGFIYNKKIFEVANIDANNIKDFASLEDAVKTLDQKIKSGELKEKFPQLEAVFEYPVKEKWVTGLHTSNAFLGLEFASSIDAYNSKTVEFKYGDQLKQIIDLQADYSSNSDQKANLTSVDYATQVDQGLAIERVAIIQQGNWIFPQVENIDPDIAKNLGILPMPISGVKENCIPVGVPMYWAVNKDKDENVKNAAEDFLNWLYTSDKGKEFIVDKFHFIPPFKGYENNRPADSLGLAVLEYSEAGNVIPWVFMGYPTGWGENVLGVNIQLYIAGESTWEDVINNCKAEWETSRK
ncbi:ABC transporter substrate-binding protein [Xylanivirga thermophila]|uniref:ABC transporter substrate-binding protein n=1 Tax=Xylanivirga thermophila TaxID=2496273 RepID=UPI00101DF524|nr:ABC transporter substrate-binding protein [Xylanivirga thermophila]